MKDYYILKSKIRSNLHVHILHAEIFKNLLDLFWTTDHKCGIIRHQEYGYLLTLSSLLCYVSVNNHRCVVTVLGFYICIGNGHNKIIE